MRTKTWVAVAAMTVLVVGVFIPQQVQALRSVDHGSLVSSDPVDHTPRVLDGRVWAIAEWNDLVVVAGDFTRVRDVSAGIVYDRDNIFAFDKYSGFVDTQFAPSINDQVRALDVDPNGRGVFVGGRFNTVNGSFRKSLVFLDRDGERVGNWRGAVKSGAVFDLKVVDQLLYVGGSFTRVNSADIGHLAAIDIADGQVSQEMALPFSNPKSGANLHVRRIDITNDGSMLGAIGSFQTIAGQSRDQIALIDLTASPDMLSTWSTDYFVQTCSTSFPSHVRDISFSPDSSFFAIAATGGNDPYPHSCDQAARYETFSTGDQDPTWVDYTGGDSLLSIEVTDHAVYVGGHNRWFNNPFGADDPEAGAVSSGSITALDPINGMPFPWSPVRQPRGQGVLEIEAVDDGLWIGHDTDFVDDEYRPRVTFFPLVSGTAVPATTAPTLPTQLAVAEGGDVVQRDFDGTSFGSPSSVVNGDSRFSGITGATLVSGKLFTTDSGGLDAVFWDDGPLPGSAIVDLRGISISSSAIDGLAYDHDLRRIYYTTGDNILRYRYFVTETAIVGAEAFTVPTNGLDFGDLRGMTIIDDRLYYGDTDGNLRSVEWLDGRPIGSPSIVSGPGIDGISWNDRGLFATSTDTALIPTAEPLARKEICGTETLRRTNSITFPVTAGDRVLGTLDVSGDNTTNLFLYDPAGRTVPPDSLVGDQSKRLRHVADQTGTWRLTSNFTSGGGCLLLAADTEIVINEAPSITPIADRTVGTADPVTIPIVVSDPEDDPFTVSVDGLPVGLALNGAGDAIEGTPTELGVFDITVTAADQFDQANTTFTLTVSNLSPSIDPIPDQTIGVLEQQSIPVVVADPEGDAVIATATGLPAGLQLDNGGAGIVGAATELGDFAVTITAADPFGSSTESFTLTVADLRPDRFEDGAIIEFTNLGSGGVLTAEGFVALTTSTPDDAARWQVEAGPAPGTFYLRNPVTGGYLDGDTTTVDTFPFPGSDRVWTVNEVTFDQFQLINVQFDRLVEAPTADGIVGWDTPPAEADDLWAIVRLDTP